MSLSVCELLLLNTASQKGEKKERKWIDLKAIIVDVVDGYDN